MKIKQIDGNDKINFSLRFKEALYLRHYEHKTLADLAEIFGSVSRTTVHSWVHAKKIPSLLAASNISLALNISFEWLLTGRGNIEGFEMKTPDEIAVIDKYRKLKRIGKQKVVKYIFTECLHYEVTPIDETDRLIEKQTALKLVPKD